MCDAGGSSSGHLPAVRSGQVCVFYGRHYESGQSWKMSGDECTVCRCKVSPGGDSWNYLCVSCHYDAPRFNADLASKIYVYLYKGISVYLNDAVLLFFDDYIIR